MKGIRLAVIRIWAEDVALEAHFYRDVLGLKLLPHHGGRPHFDLGGYYLVILQRKPCPAQSLDSDRFPLVAFAVDDLNEAIDSLQKHQVVMPWGEESDEASRWVMFYDPAGNLIELVEFTGQSVRGEQA
jgi:catechol 2,3-dioxygenase-like lactoylglutathione lyase family enzyme